MGRAPCCDKANVKKGPWSPEEDAKLKEFIEKHGTGGNWIVLPKNAGLKRCGKSCRLRWLNYLRPNIKHGEFSEAEDKIICSLYASIGSRWSVIASQLQGRTDNDIKNYWNTKLKKKLMAMKHSMDKKPQQVTLLSIFQNSTSPSSLSFTDTSNNNNNNNNNNSYYHSNGTFTGSVSSSLLSGNSSTSVSNSSIFQAQESFIGSTQKWQFKDRNKTFVFGGEATSCSSSNGSCSNQVSHVKEQELVYGDYLCSGVEDTQKLMFSSAGGVNGLWVENENPMDYGGLEEIKELISTSSCNNFLFDDDDKKTEEKVMYY